MTYLQEVHIVRWANTGTEELESLGFFKKDGYTMHHGSYEMTDSQKWATIKDLYNTGLNVQLRHNVNGFQVILVDKGDFRQG